MLTPWGECLDKNKILQEYPRPQLRRDSYLNLNGTWDYAITGSFEPPEEYDGEILVPFSPEAELSGVGRTLSPGEFLWYRKAARLPEGFNEGRLLLHFGAVDQAAKVYVNGTEVASHVGGYTPFSADITKAVGEETEFTLTVCVRDSTDTSWHTRGKQKSDPGGIWHTPQSGIWQTVWMESVPENYIKGIRLIPRFDSGSLELWVAAKGPCCAMIGGTQYNFEAGKPAVLKLDEMHPWSPEDPFLYDLKLTLQDDEVSCYFAMRKFSVESDEAGVRRLFLNGRPYFHNGILDQGYWPDGLMTAPDDEAFVFDIETAKKMGYNMLRKHMKIEPLRFYYHCDRLGMLVWQDMPCGGGKYGGVAAQAALRTGRYIKDDKYGALSRKDESGRNQFILELREMVNHLYNCCCIAMWAPFSEGWGQFDSKAVCDVIYKTDQSRTVDHASGCHDQFFGETCSKHVYGKKYACKPDPQGRAMLLSEFGGLLHRVDGHCFSEREFGYKKFDSVNSFKYALWDLYRSQIKPAREQGLSAAVYAQLSDVEEELTGLVTYDRRVVKIAPSILENIIK